MYEPGVVLLVVVVVVVKDADKDKDADDDDETRGCLRRSESRDALDPEHGVGCSVIIICEDEDATFSFVAKDGAKDDE